MALSKAKKLEVVDEVAQLLSTSKMTVISAYQGTPVKALQALRRQAKDNGTAIKVVKNRLVKKALEGSETFKDIDTTLLSGMLLYAFNAEDEVAPAQVLQQFAKTQDTISFVGALTADGTFIAAEDVKALASLPTKDQLRAQLIGTIRATERLCQCISRQHSRRHERPQCPSRNY